MRTTRISMIRNLSTGESGAWSELDRIYRPMISSWLQRYSLQHSDHQDVIQDVMAVIVREIAIFEHNGRQGAFRNWLRSTTVNLVRNHLRRLSPYQGAGTDALVDMLNQLEDPNSVASQDFDREHERHVVRRAVERVSKMFEPMTLEIFRLHVLEGHSIQVTSERLAVPSAVVYAAKSRVLRKIREYASDCMSEI